MVGNSTREFKDCGHREGEQVRKLKMQRDKISPLETLT